MISTSLQYSKQKNQKMLETKISQLCATVTFVLLCTKTLSETTKEPNMSPAVYISFRSTDFSVQCAAVYSYDPHGIRLSIHELQIALAE